MYATSICRVRRRYCSTSDVDDSCRQTCLCCRYRTTELTQRCTESTRVGIVGALMLSRLTRTREGFSSARARASSCFCPALSGAPPSCSAVSRPAGQASTTLSRWALYSWGEGLHDVCTRETGIVDLLSLAYLIFIKSSSTSQVKGTGRLQAGNSSCVVGLKWGRMAKFLV